MRVLLTGASGYIGGAVLGALLDRGHEVTAAVRSETAAAKAKAGGATPVIGSLGDRDWFAGLLEGSDAAVHIAHPTPDEYDAVLDAVDRVYQSTGKPFITTSGCWMFGDGHDITEDDPVDPPALVSFRTPREERVLAPRGYRTAIVMAGVVYGHGGGMIPGLLVDDRTEDGAVRLIGDGDQHWLTVHVDDLAELYVRVLETDAASGRYLAVSGVNPTVRELAEATGAPVVAETAAEAEKRFGEEFAAALLLDQQATGAKARTLGWTPTRPTAIEEIRGASK